MPSAQHHLALGLLLSLVAVHSGKSTAACQEKPDAFYDIVQVIRDIPRGAALEKALMSVAPKAHIVQGGRDELLMSILTGDVRGISLIDTAYQSVAIRAQTNHAEDMGFVVTKSVKTDTTAVRYHTAVIMKDSTGAYKIVFWHAGQ
jgi:hypothetical protein